MEPPALDGFLEIEASREGRAKMRKKI